MKLKTILAICLLAVTGFGAETVTVNMSLSGLSISTSAAVPHPTYKITLAGQSIESTNLNQSPAQSLNLAIGQVYNGRIELVDHANPEDFNLFNTGVDNGRVAMSVGSQETHWYMYDAYYRPVAGYVTAPSSNNFYLREYAIANSSASAWIATPGDGTFYSQTFSIPSAQAASAMVMHFRALAAGYYPNESVCNYGLQDNPSSTQYGGLATDIKANDWAIFTVTNLVSGNNTVSFSLGLGFSPSNYLRVEFLPFTFRDANVDLGTFTCAQTAHLNATMPSTPTCLRLFINGNLGTFSHNLAQASWQKGSCDFTFMVRAVTNENPVVAWEPYAGNPKATCLSPSARAQINPDPSIYYSLPADGKPQIQARVLAPYNTNAVTFTIAGDARGCSITDGILTTGTSNGTITVIAAGINDACISTTYKFNLVPNECQTCVSCQGPGGVSPINKNVHATIPLGSSPIAGNPFLLVSGDVPSPLLGTPAALSSSFDRPDIDSIMDGANLLTQVKAQDGLFTVNTNSGNSFSVNFYPASQVLPKTNGLYGFTGNPYKTITFENVNADTDHFRVTDSTKGIIADYYWQGTGWDMVTGGGLRKEARQEVVNGNQRTVTKQILNSNNQIESESAELYQTFPLGEQLLMQVTGTGATAKTNQFVYDSDGRLITNINASGTWEIFTYDAQGRQTHRYSPFLNSAPTTNSADCRLTVYGYSPNAVAGSYDDGQIMANTPRCTIEYIQGQEVSRSYTVQMEGQRRDIKCTVPGAAWDDANNLVTTTWFYVDAYRYGKTYRVFHPNGTVDANYDDTVTLNGNTYLRQTHYSGAINANAAFVAGTKTETLQDPATLRTLQTTTMDITSGYPTDQQTWYYDSQGHVTNTVSLDGSQTFSAYDCCHKQADMDHNGVVTSYGYDALDRLVSTTREGVTTLNELDASGRTLKTHRIGTNGTDIVTSEAAYDSNGQQLWSKDALGRISTTTNSVDANGQISDTTTYIDTVRTSVSARDGSLLLSTNNAGTKQRYEYGVEQIGGANHTFTKTIMLNTNGVDTAEWTKSFQNAEGQTVKTLFSDGASNTMSYVKGQLVSSMDPDGVVTLYGYNSLGQMEVQAIDMNQNGSIDAAGLDRINQTVDDVVMHGTNVVRRNQTWVFDQANNAMPTLIGWAETAVDARKSWNFGASGTNQNVETFNGDGTRTSTTTEGNGTTTETTFQGDRLISTVITDAAGTLLQNTQEYDEFNRLVRVNDTRNGATTYSYNNAGQVVTITNPPPSTGVTAPVTSSVYDDYGRVTLEQRPDGTTKTNLFYLDGSLQMETGAGTYPVQYTYDYAGRKKTMITFGAAGAANTTWNYNSRGLLTSKMYADNHGPSYTYTPAGRLKTRTWARGVVTTYGYDNAGGMTSITYSDGTPNITMGYDRLGNPNSVNGITTNILTYSAFGQLLGEDASSMSLNYYNQLRLGYDAVGRQTSISNALLNYTALMGWAGNRATSVSEGNRQTSYEYVANSPLLATTTIQQGGSNIVTASRQYDYLNRLLSISSGQGLSAAYAYNAINQRTALTNGDGSAWSYGYDFLGQVTNGTKRWVGGTHAAGQQFAYFHDAIGNRTYTGVGGNSDGTGMRQAQYNVNSLNQYTSREIPGFVEASGSAATSASITVNGQATTRQNDYFRVELQVSNSVAGVFTNIAIRATDATSTNNVAKLTFVPKTPETFQYDLDGNTTQDVRHAYQWDAENQMIRAESLTNTVPGERRLQSDYVYDWQSRRIAKTVKRYNPEANNYQTTVRCKFYYEGWNLIAEQDEVTGRLYTYVWGQDLSGSRQGAGGVGGLLTVTVHSGPNAGTYAYVYDGNGNVIALINTADGSIAAQYEYGPFGELIKATGPMAKENHFRFSTKYQDDETGLLYYGYRYYDPSTGRWMSRDPIDEQGGLNLAGFVNNDPLLFSDSDGKDFGIWIGAGSGYERWNKPNQGPTTPRRRHIKLTLAQGLQKISAGAELLKKKCQECSKCKEREDAYDTQACASDAQRIIDAIKLAWSSNYGKSVNYIYHKGDTNDSIGGYLCWDWARAFDKAAKSVGSKCWSSRQVVYTSYLPGRVHVFAMLQLAESSDCKVLIDDGFFEGEMVHTPPWPNEFGYSAPWFNTEIPPKRYANPKL